MSISGNGTLSIRKKDVKESKSTAVGFKNLKFAHRANAGDTGIDITALTLPSELTGFTNPSSATLLAANMRRYRDNLRIVSSLSGELLDYASYNVTATNITFNGFTAQQDEIFVGYLDSAPSSGISVVSAQPIVATGELPIAATDFNVGALFTTNANPTKQVGDVEVYRNGLQQFRCVGNDLTNEGNYIEVNNGTGMGQIIRFKNAPSGQEDSILVTSVSSLAEKPNDSQLAQLETVAGQVDKLIDVISEELEIPSTDFQAAANEPDLKQFGDRVLGLEEPGQPGSPKLATTTVAGAQLKNKIQLKPLNSSITNLNTTLGDMTFNNLVVGKIYTVRGALAANISASSTDNVSLSVVHNGSDVAEASIPLGYISAFGNIGFAATFTATATTLTFVTSSVGPSTTVLGNGSRNQSTWAELEERNDLVFTADFT